MMYCNKKKQSYEISYCCLSVYVLTFHPCLNTVITHINFVFTVLRARRNEKEMKVKPATSFKLLTIFIHKKKKKKKKKDKIQNKRM